MPRNRQPTSLLVAKGKSHMGKAEIEERKARETVVMQWKDTAQTEEVSDSTAEPANNPKLPSSLPKKTYHYVFEFPNITREQCISLKNCLDGNLIEYTFKKI